LLLFCEMSLSRVARGLARPATTRAASLRAYAAIAGHGHRWAPATKGAAPVPRHFSAGASIDAQEDVDIDGVAYAFMSSQALFAALEIGLYDHIAAAGEAGLSAAGVADACNLHAPRLQTLLTALTAMKSLRRSADGMYTLSPNTAQYAVKTSRHYYGDYLRFQIGRQFYHRMGSLSDTMVTGEAPSYASWFSDPEVAKTYTEAQHNGSVATAKYLIRKKMDLGDVKDMLDVGGGSGAFSYVFVENTPGLKSTVLELPEVCRTGEGIKAGQKPDVQERVSFAELDATSPDWPVNDAAYDVVLMSYISGSVPEAIISQLYANAFKALRPGGRLLVHDFMVHDSLDGPALGALWGLQHVTVNADGLGLCPAEIIKRMAVAGFDPANVETQEMIHGMTKVLVAHKK